MRKEKPKREYSLTQRFWAEVAVVLIAVVFVIASVLRAQQADQAQQSGQVATLSAIANATAVFERASEHDTEGLSLLAQSDWLNAVVEFSQAIDLEPSAERYANRARAYAGMEDYDHAIADFTEALERDQLVAYRRERADLYFQAGRYAEAIDAYTAVISAEPEDFSIYFNRGEAYREDGQFKNAFNDYNMVIESGSEPEADAYFYRAFSAYELGNLDQTIDDYKEYLTFYPDDPAAHYNLGLVYHDRDDYETALGYFTASIKLTPDDPDSYYQRARVYQEQGAWSKAIQDFDWVLDLRPDHYDALVFRGSAHHELEDYDAALADFDRAIAIKPDDAHSYSQRGFTYAALGDRERAGADWDRAINMGIKTTRSIPLPAMPNEIEGEIAESGLQLQYTFKGTAGGLLNVELTATNGSDFDGVLLLRDPADQPLAFSDDAYDEGYDPLLAEVELPTTGTYTLVVVGYNGTSTGAFRLHVIIAEPST